jgi:hypothetical protein
MRCLHCWKGRAISLATIFWNPINFNQIVFCPKTATFFLCLRSPAVYFLGSLESKDG